MKLATKEAVAQALGRDLTDEESKRAEHLLTILSAKFCQEARTTFTPVTYTHRVKVNGRPAPNDSPSSPSPPSSTTTPSPYRSPSATDTSTSTSPLTGSSP